MLSDVVRCDDIVYRQRSCGQAHGAITMSRVTAVLGSALFFVIAPLTIAGLVPWWMSRWIVQPSFLGIAALRALGVLLIVLGVQVVLESFGRFALDARGTRAPVLATR